MKKENGYALMEKLWPRQKAYVIRVLERLPIKDVVKYLLLDWRLKSSGVQKLER